MKTMSPSLGFSRRFHHVLLCMMIYFALSLASDGFLPTCPSFDPRCQENNVCIQCHPSCEYCQRLVMEGELITCGASDCVSCQPNLIHQPIYDDSTGMCVEDVQEILRVVPEDQRGKLFVINLMRRP